MHQLVCVEESRNNAGNVYFPPTIPKKRSENLLQKWFISCCCFVVGITCASDKKTYCLLLPYSVAFLLSYEIIHRMIILWTEMQHLKSRYDNKLFNLLINTFSFSLTNSLLLILSFGFLICSSLLWKNQWNGLNGMNWCCSLSLLFIILELRRILRMDDYPLNEAMLIERLNCMDYGSGMAYSYFFGYLKLSLSKNGPKDKDLKELMCDYEANQNVFFRVKKLFILMPLSAKCPVTLDNPELGIEESTPLDEKQITVAGVKDRVYKSSVYKILLTNDTKKVYVCTEFATPLKTFHDVMNSKSHFASYYRKHRKEIVSNFYRTLKMLLEEYKEVKELCEIIYYDDVLPNGQYRTDIGNIILNRIDKLTRRV